MKSVKNYYSIAVFLTFCLLAATHGVSAQDFLSPKDRQIFTDFEKRASDYVNMRETLEGKMPKLSREATAAEIETHKMNLQKSVQAARAAAKKGEIFSPATEELIRTIISKEFSGSKELSELLESVTEADTKGVPLRVNYPYPESKEEIEIPPALLLRMPQLPKQLRYRFVGSNLLLVDRENELILDYMTKALPLREKNAANQQQPQQVEEETPQPNSSSDTAGSSSSSSSNVKNTSLRLTLPLKENSLRFIATGDTGRGTPVQYDISRMMLNYRQAFPFEFIILTGDNLYGSEKAEDYKKKFEDVYRPILDLGVKFYATLGNHDGSNQRFYEHFNMNGEEYYRFKKGEVSFYALNTKYMDKRQVEWLEKELAADASQWKIAFFHHPPYSSGKFHGSSESIREMVEPLFLRYGVDVVFNGHEHFYERLKPQKGIYYFITGAGGQVRKDGVKKNSPMTDKAYDQDLSFMLVEIADYEMHFQVVSRTGETVDSGVIKRRD